MGSFTRKTIAMILSLAMMITLFAGLGFMEVNAVGGHGRSGWYYRV